METIVFIGCNKSGTSRDVLGVSADMGYYTVLLTNRKQLLKQREEISEVDELVYMDDLFDKEQIMTVIKGLEEQAKEVKAVISFIDPFVSYAAQIGYDLGINPLLSIEALAIMENKIKFREQLKSLSISPKYFFVDLNQDNLENFANYSNDFPLVLKAPSSNGSKDVLLAASKEELVKSLFYFQKKFSGKTILLEEFIPGSQYLIEVYVHNGTVKIAAVVEQEIEYNNRFIITGYLYPGLLEEDERLKLNSAVMEIMKTIGLSYGTCHLEMRLVHGEWKLIEINPRMAGGAMNRLIKAGSGINLAKETLRLYVGESPDVETKTPHYAFAKYITIQAEGRLIKVRGGEQAIAYPGVQEVFIKPQIGAYLTRPYSLGDRYAYVIAAAESADEARSIALEAAGKIKFYLEPLYRCDRFEMDRNAASS